MRVALKGSRNIPALKAFKANNKKQIIEFVTNLGNLFIPNFALLKL